MLATKLPKPAKVNFRELELVRPQIISAIRDGWLLTTIESRYDRGRSRISKWLKACYGRTYTELRRDLDNDRTAIVCGEVYYLIASNSVKADIATNLELNSPVPNVKEMPDGEYHLWLYEDVICVSCTKNYGTVKGVWKKTYKARINTDDYPTGTVFIKLGANLEVPMLAEDIADLFGLIWFPLVNQLNIQPRF